MSILNATYAQELLSASEACKLAKLGYRQFSQPSGEWNIPWPYSEYPFTF